MIRGTRVFVTLQSVRSVRCYRGGDVRICFWQQPPLAFLLEIILNKLMLMCFRLSFIAFRLWCGGDEKSRGNKWLFFSLFVYVLSSLLSNGVTFLSQTVFRGKAHKFVTPHHLGKSSVTRET